jgi:hypothetical protein
VTGPPLLGAQQDEDNAIVTGKIILLVDVQTTDLMNAATASFSLKLGTMPVPAACTNPSDLTTCGQHLKGGASFSIANDSPAFPPLTGTITDGTFSSSAGDVAIALALTDTATSPVVLNLAHARARITSMTADGIMTAYIGGLVTQTELNNQIAPPLGESVSQLLSAANCTPNGPPDCGCKIGTPAVVLLFAMDGDTGVPANCAISDQEILAYPPIAATIQNDSCSQADCTTPDSISFGLQISAVKATFPTN